jgi:diguanylate cyclase (GGDEF)-like protein
LRERGIGAMLALVAVALTCGLARLPSGIYIAAAIMGLAGWVLGGYVRSLARLAERDELTGIYNRRPFERALNREWEVATRTGQPLSLLFLDVDDFGAINKKYGHLMGDEVLKAVARQIQRSVRKTDIVARWGGEEFVILLPGADIGTAAIVAERIRTQIAQCQVWDRDRAVSVTVSTGVAGFPGTARSPMELLRCAIYAQNTAKAHKNCCEIVS